MAIRGFKPTTPARRKMTVATLPVEMRKVELLVDTEAAELRENIEL